MQNLGSVKSEDRIMEPEERVKTRTEIEVEVERVVKQWDMRKEKETDNTQGVPQGVPQDIPQDIPQDVPQGIP